MAGPIATERGPRRQRPSTDSGLLARPDEQGSDSTFTVLLAMGANALIAATKSVAAAVTGSPSLVAEAAHSWVDAANEVFLLVAQRRSGRAADTEHPGGFGREAYVWSMFAAIGLFAVGGTFSVIHGLQQLWNPEPTQHFALAYTILLVSAALEGISFVQSSRQGRREARRADRDLLPHILATSDPTLRAVFAEDAAALCGIAIAGSAILGSQVTGSAVPDAMGSIAIGVLLGVVSFVLIDRNRRFLIGEAVDSRLRNAALEALLAGDTIVAVTYLHLEYSGPRQVALLARVDLAADAPESEVAARLAAVEQAIEARPGVSRAVLALAHPGDQPLRPD